MIILCKVIFFNWLIIYKLVQAARSSFPESTISQPARFRKILLLLATKCKTRDVTIYEVSGDSFHKRLRQCNMVKWLFVISYGSLLTFSDNLSYISKGMFIFV